jgi:hypothetical protein
MDERQAGVKRPGTSAENSTAKRWRGDRTTENKFAEATANNSLELRDIHTHLMGMGSAQFWCDNIVFDDAVLPAHATFCEEDSTARDILGPLLWDHKNRVWFGSEKFASLIAILRNDSTREEQTKEINEQLGEMKDCLDETLWSLLDTYKLTFSKDFCYDIVYKEEKLSQALDLPLEMNADIRLTHLEARLGISHSQEPITFKHYIIFNAREQKFQVAYGIRNEDLVKLVNKGSDARNPVQRATEAFIRNAFTMCNPDGSQPEILDFHTFRGAFTPQFYPRRFALKDCLYEQRLDILAYLLQHVLSRYSACSPSVKYVEFSVSCSDLSRPWVLDVLKCFNSREGDEVSKKLRLHSTFSHIKVPFVRE